MPPVLSRKRLRSDSPDVEPQSKRPRARNLPSRRTKESVFQTLDAAPKVKRTLSQTKAFLEQEGSDSELSDPESSEEDFEDVPLQNGTKSNTKSNTEIEDESNQSEDEDWEDALGGHHHTKGDHGPMPVVSGDIALTLSAVPKTIYDMQQSGRQGPSKKQRRFRNMAHCMHVQYLMFHNLTRNAWIQDKEVQKILVENMSPGCWRELEQYWRDAGITDGPTRVAASMPRSKEAHKPAANDTKGRWKESLKKGVKVYESPQAKQAPREDKIGRSKSRDDRTRKGDRPPRDWGAASEPLEPNTPNLSAGDPLIRLMKYLSAYWKSKFRITAPSLRKRGYLSPAALQAEITAWREDPSHADFFGERIENIKDFRQKAKTCEGSRDLGQQLFIALVRGIGIEARMIVSLQPVGFGFSQSEEGKPKNMDKLEEVKTSTTHKTPVKSSPNKGKVPQRAATKQTRVSTKFEEDESSDLSSVISISSDTEDERPVKKSPKTRDYSEELPYPTYWTEAISHLTHTPISVSPLPRTLIASAAAPDRLSDFYARGAAADKAKQVIAYLIAFSNDGTAKDVTTRYLPKHQWPGRTKGLRMPVEKIPIHNKRGKVKRWEEWDWFKSLMRPYARPHHKQQPWDNVEDEGDLVPGKPEKKKEMDEEGGKETLQGYKNSSEYVLERHLRREEALKPGAKIVRHFVTGKGDKEKSEPVYRRKDIVNCKTVESWHKEGREIRTGEQPLKFVPMRAVTINRKREIEEQERLEGGKAMQGLYGRGQTEWIIPDPIVDGKIPRNAFGNIDVYVPTMIPKGSVHIPLKGTARVCRKLNIDHAEACTGFEFGKQRAVPVLTGVVVAEENEQMVIDAWEVAEAEKAKKEADKRQTLVLGMWKKFASGLRIIERMKAEYGDAVDLPEKKVVPKKDAPVKKSEWDVFQNHSDFEGGFVRDDAGGADGGFVREEARPQLLDEDLAGGFLVASQEEIVHGDLTIDHGEEKEEVNKHVVESAYRTPISLTATLQQLPSDLDDESADDDVGKEDARATEPSEEDEPAPKPSPKGSRSAVKPTRGRRRGRGTKATPTSTRNRRSIVIDSSGEDSALSDAPSNSPTPPPLTSSAPKRKAARKSDTQVKSHFFAEGSDAETDLTDMTDRASPKKKAATRGKSSSRGRGRGRGKARAKNL